MGDALLGLSLGLRLRERSRRGDGLLRRGDLLRPLGDLLRLPRGGDRLRRSVRLVISEGSLRPCCAKRTANSFPANIILSSACLASPASSGYLNSTKPNPLGSLHHCSSRRAKRGMSTNRFHRKQTSGMRQQSSHIRYMIQEGLHFFCSRFDFGRAYLTGMLAMDPNANMVILGASRSRCYLLCIIIFGEIDIPHRSVTLEQLSDFIRPTPRIREEFGRSKVSRLQRDLVSLPARRTPLVFASLEEPIRRKRTNSSIRPNENLKAPPIMSRESQHPFRYESVPRPVVLRGHPI